MKKWVITAVIGIAIISIGATVDLFSKPEKKVIQDTQLLMVDADTVISPTWKSPTSWNVIRIVSVVDSTRTSDTVSSTIEMRLSEDGVSYGAWTAVRAAGDLLTGSGVLVDTTMFEAAANRWAEFFQIRFRTAGAGGDSLYLGSCKLILR